MVFPCSPFTVHRSSDDKLRNNNLYLRWGCPRLPYDLTGHTFSPGVIFVSPGVIFVGHPLLGRLAALLNFLFSYVIPSACSSAKSHLCRNRQTLEGWHPAKRQWNHSVLTKTLKGAMKPGCKLPVFIVAAHMSNSFNCSLKREFEILLNFTSMLCSNVSINCLHGYRD